MSKYIHLRPAGMSDDDSDDDDDDFFSREDIKERGSPRDDSTKEEKRIDSDKDKIYVSLDEERTSENRIVKACIMGHLEVIQEYLEQYDINKFLHTGWTPLLYATSSVQPEIIEQLLAHGANPNKYKDGFTPLMALCNSIKETAEKSLKCLLLLIQAKADVNITNSRRETALMYACKLQDAEFVAELVKHVKNINASDSDGKSALSYAAAANKPDVVKILLEHNADILLKDKNNISAKDIADIKGFTEISVLLAEDEEETLISCETSQITTWRDLFQDLYPKSKETVAYDISVILYGMGLERYSDLFKGMDLKTFLQLTEDDVCRLGIDITVHREQFLENIERFHNKKWHANSLGMIKKTSPYTIYDGALALANVKTQIGVIASSFQYIRNNLTKAESENIRLSAAERTEYEKELKKTGETLLSLKDEMTHIKKLAQKIEKENNIGTPATFINSKKNKSDWTITLGIILMMGLCLCKTGYIQRLWNNTRM